MNGEFGGRGGAANGAGGANRPGPGRAVSGESVWGTAEAAAEAAAAAGRFGFVRRVCNRTYFSMADQHYLVNVFRGKQPHGQAAAIAILVFAVECQIMSATLLFYVHSCYTLGSVFDDDALDTVTLIQRSGYLDIFFFVPWIS